MDALDRNAKRILTGAEAPAPDAQAAWSGTSCGQWM